MKFRKAKRDNKGTKMTFLSLLFILIFTVILLKNFSGYVDKFALFSLYLTAPQSTFQMIKNDFVSPTASSYGTSTEASPKSDLSVQVPPSTPSDIETLAQEYKNNYSGTQNKGEIVEKTYDKSNATSVYKNILVRNNTPSHSINIEKSLNEPLNLNLTDYTKPTVLIFHTHTTESYELIDEGWFSPDYPTRHDDPNQNMVRVGNAICEELEKNNIGYIHDTQIHDHKYTGAYDNSRETVLKILEENPTIQIVIDVHRDAIHQSDTKRVKPVTTVNGKKAAQVMIITGCEDGKVASFPGWEQNLTFSLRFQQTAETMYPTLMRPVFFAARKYNMDVVPCSALFEFGSDSNTLSEAEYSGHLVGTALSEFIKNNTVK